MLKVHVTKENRAGLLDIVQVFRAKIVDLGKDDMVIELTGEEGKIDALIEVLQDGYEIIEIARTGAIALSRGVVPAKDM